MSKIKKLCNAIDWSIEYMGAVPSGVFEVKKPFYKIAERGGHLINAPPKSKKICEIENAIFCIEDFANVQWIL